MFKLKNIVFLTLSLLILLTSSVSAETHRYYTSSPTLGFPYAGELKLLDVSYNNETEVLQWKAIFTELHPNSYIPDAFYLSLNGTGASPKGHDGELAIFYFDATDTNNPVLNVFSYNGINDGTSFRDGSSAPGIQFPDPILTSLNPAHVAANDVQISVSDTVSPTGHRNREFFFQLDATVIQEHIPTYAGNLSSGEVWQGAQFEDKLGYWFFPRSGVTTNYNSAGFLADTATANGYDITGSAYGAYDEKNLPTEDVTPSCVDAPDVVVAVGETVNFNVKGTSAYSNLGSQVTGAPADAVISDSFEFVPEVAQIVNVNWTPSNADEGSMSLVTVNFNGHNSTVSCSTKITVLPNPAPVANATSIGSLSCSGDRTTIALDGSGSYDANNGPSPVLGYQWLTSCPNAVFSNAKAAQTTITFDTTVDNKPTGCTANLFVGDGHKIDEAQVSLAVTGCVEDCAGTINGAADIDKCGVCNGLDKDLDRCGICNGDGNSCLECTQTNQAVTLAELDGGLLQIHEDVERLAITIRQNNNGRFGRRLVQLLADSEAVYEAGWRNINTVPAVVTQCGNQQFCFNVNYDQQAANFEANSLAVRNIAKTFKRKLTRILNRNGVNRVQKRRLKRPFKRAKAQHLQNVATIDTLFVNSDTCQ